MNPNPEFREATKHELENALRCDSMQRRALLADGLERRDKQPMHLMSLIDTRLDIYPYGERRSEVSLEAARHIVKMYRAAA